MKNHLNEKIYEFKDIMTDLNQYKT